ncbi:MAG: sugar ABC transporter permease [Tagaea sp.]|nr:sugar ABC transporter permease [Tagaea sp.]
MLAQQRRRLAFWLILPSLLLITLFKLAPIGEGVLVSLQSQSMMRPNPEAFVGLAHYERAIFEERVFGQSLWNTVVWTLGSVAGAYIVGLSLALLLNREFGGRSIFRALFLVPWVIPEVATALLWKWAYSDEFGVINFILFRLHVIDRPLLFLSDVHSAMPAVIVVQIWKLYPIMFITLLAALQSVPKELHEAAEIDGASLWQRFRFVTFPFIRPTSVIITLLASIWTFQNFDLIYLLTGGGPAGATKILPTLIYEKGFWGLELGYASAIGMLMLMCLTVLSVAYLMVYRAQRGDT